MIKKQIVQQCQLFEQLFRKLREDVEDDVLDPKDKKLDILLKNLKTRCRKAGIAMVTPKK